MAIVVRNGRPYAYRSVRVDGRVRVEYIGAGLVALLHEWQTEEDKQEKEERRRRRQAEIEAMKRRDGQSRRRSDGAIEKATRLLESLGYHRQRRGPWRRKRRAGGMSNALATTAPSGGQLGGMAQPRDLQTSARNIVRSAVRAMQIYDTEWKVASRSGSADQDALKGEAYRTFLAEIAAQVRSLAGESPTAIELELSETAALTCFELRLAEIAFASKMPSGLMADEARDRWAVYIDRLRRRYQSLLRTLADVRRLAAPTVRLGVDTVHATRATAELSMPSPEYVAQVLRCLQRQEDTGP